MMTTNFITTININGIMEIPAFITQKPLNPQKTKFVIQLIRM